MTGPTTYRAKWILPIAAEPLLDAFITVAEGWITGLRPADGESPSGVIDLGRVVVLPGLVNAHLHLELSHLRNQVAPAIRFTDWVRDLIQKRRAETDPLGPAIVDAAARAIGESRAAGTALVGDVSNTLLTVPLLQNAACSGVVFYEMLGFNPASPGGDPETIVARARERLEKLPNLTTLRTSLAPHAPYSVSPRLCEAIRRDLDRHGDVPSTVHIAESVEEVALLARAAGPWRSLLEELGVWTDDWRAPGVSPVAYLASIGFLDRRVLAVHAVQCSADDLAMLAMRGVTIVSCPRSNQHVGVGPPPLEAFYAAGVSVAFGTDSLASVNDLSIFAELAEARRLAPGIQARRLIESATLVGARALGFGREFGSIEPGKRAALLAVRVPEDVGFGRAGSDEVSAVEEYLVSGVRADAIEWL